MIIDTSALLSILLSEPERSDFIAAIDLAEARAISAASFVECSIVLAARHGADAIRALDLLLAKAAIDIVPVDVEQAHLARKAHRIYGKGHHVAKLNFGDCFPYALAQVTGEPLLFKGGDFALTDVQRHAASC